jgi:hypothetical protein
MTTKEGIWNSIDGKNSLYDLEYLVYYTKDSNGDYSIPKIIIELAKYPVGYNKLSNRRKIYYIFGYTENYNIEEGMEVVLRKKLLELNGLVTKSSVEFWLNRLDLAEKINFVKNKSLSNIELTNDEISLLYGAYEVNDDYKYDCDYNKTIYGYQFTPFGEGIDPKIEEAILLRNYDEDYYKMDDSAKRILDYKNKCNVKKLIKEN